MTEFYVFTGVYLFTFGWGYSHPSQQGNTHILPDGGYDGEGTPHPDQGTHLSRSGPMSGQGKGHPLPIQLRSQVRMGGTPSQVRMGEYPGVTSPLVKVRSQVRTRGKPNRNSTAVSGVPLAFTQEDFLVQRIEIRRQINKNLRKGKKISQRIL